MSPTPSGVYSSNDLRQFATCSSVPKTGTTTETDGVVDHDPQPPRPIADADHRDIGQTDQQRAHPRSIRFQAGAPRNSLTSNITENCRAPATRSGSTRSTDPNPQAAPYIRYQAAWQSDHSSCRQRPNNLQEKQECECNERVRSGAGPIQVPSGLDHLCESCRNNSSAQPRD